MYNTLQKNDPKLFDLIKEEEHRQLYSLELIASENFTSPAVMECLGSILTNKYSEGRIDRRYYGGNQVIDKIETLCIERALKTFRLDPEKWGINVQPYSGSIANLAVYNALLNPHERLMGLDLPSGGHLTHGFYTAKKKISVSSIFFESMPYHINSSGFIDYDELENNAIIFKPKLIICGASAYPRDYDYPRFRKIADKVGAYLMCDMAHFSGLVATQQCNNPFDYCDIVTSTTHKTLRGPRSALIFYKKEFDEKINSSVFPSIQGGPHNHQIAALATQLNEVMTDEFKQYIIQVKLNAKYLADTLINFGYSLSSNGTDNHLILMQVSDKGIMGSKIEKICEYVDISLNKNSIYGDTSALNPGGIRLGTSWLTTRGFMEDDFVKIGEFLHRSILIAITLQEKSGKLIKDFVNEFDNCHELQILKNDVHNLCKKFIN